ncbi:MAG: tRNA pseudouridine(38-40) synthase TruA [Clostridia bacterium]|nr:tRNA pseudouridine(38-40) synthase TruA [Clostridia bacterium]
MAGGFSSSEEKKARARRIRLQVEYDGTRYAGWQRQAGLPTVQQELEDALGKLMGVKRVIIHGASRTDAGVHAVGQVAHFDCTVGIPAEKVAFALNTMLPEDIRICASVLADPDFHARFQAKGKIYRYGIWNHRHASALFRMQHTHIPTPLNLPLMRQEMQAMLGTHDFRAFEASGGLMTGKERTERTVHNVSLEQSGPCLYLMIYGNAFLYNMVRIFAGTLIDVGRGRIEPGAIARALHSGDRLQLGITAPANGLTLLRVFYGDPNDQDEADALFAHPKYSYKRI